jgi:hypothetical protein
MSLTEFSGSLKAGDCHAVYVQEDEQHIEGPCWLAHLTEAMTEADKDCVYAGTKNCRTAALARTDTKMIHVYTYKSSPLKPLLLAYVPLSLSLSLSLPQAGVSRRDFLS